MSFEFDHYCNSLEFTNVHGVLNNFYGQYLSAISANVSPKHGLSPRASASPVLILDEDITGKTLDDAHSTTNLEPVSRSEVAR
jgi:hypothetical protein